MTRASVLLGLSVPMLLAGCASFPKLPDEPQVSVSDIITNVECEIQNAIFYGFPDFPWLVEWAAQITLTLNTQTSAGGDVSVGFDVPLRPGLFQFGLGAGASGQNTSNGSFTYSLYLDDIGPDRVEYCLRERRSILTGHTGVGDWIAQAATGVAETGNKPKDINYSIEFVIRSGGSGSSDVALIPVGSATVGGGVRLSGGREDTHKLSVVLAPAENDTTAGAIEVFRAARLRLGLKIDEPGEEAVPERRRPVDPDTQRQLDEAEQRTILRELSTELNRP